MASLIRYGILTLLLIGLGFVVYAWLASTSTPNRQEGLKSFAVGSMKGLQFRPDAPDQPDGIFKGPDDEDVSFADFRGQILLVNYWGTFCAPCIKEMPTLAALQTKYPEDQLKVMAVSVDRVGDYPQARKELDELTGGVLEFYADPTHGVLFDSSVGGFPTTIIYDAKGDEIARYEGDADWISDEALVFFDAVVAG